MELAQFTVEGIKNYLFFVDKTYVGFNHDYGVFAIAREYQKSTFDPNTGERIKLFELTYCDKILAKGFKKCISKIERICLPTKIVFDEYYIEKLYRQVALELRIIKKTAMEIDEEYKKEKEDNR